MIKIANAPCSWGVLEFDLAGQAAGYRQVLDEMQETGYLGTELGDWGFMPTDPQQLREELQRRGLALLGAFVPVNLKDSGAHPVGVETAIRTARLLAEAEPPHQSGTPSGDLPFLILADENGKDPIRTQNAGRITPEMGLSDAGWQVFAEGAETIAREVRQETGLRTVFHHHCAGYVETPAEIERLMGLTDPTLLGLVFDTGHYCFGGGDPSSGLQRFGSRAWHFHLKDYQPQVGAQAKTQGWDYFTSVRNGIFCELGKGQVNFAALIAELERQSYQGWGVVEQDVLPGMGNPRESAMRNRQFLHSIGL